MRKFTPYTLIEIMIVMALAAVLVTLALPAFSALMRGNSVGITCGMIKNTMDQAQARAITDRKYAATVFDLTGEASGLTDTQAMRNCYISYYAPSNSYGFAGWMENSQWVKLDQEAQILTWQQDRYGDALGFPTSGSDTPIGPMETIGGVQRENGSSSVALPGIVFSSHGNVCAPNCNMLIGVGEATLVNGNYIYKNPDSSGRETNIMAVRINHFTGRSQISLISESGHAE